MVFVVGTILAVTSEALQPRKKQNAADKKMIDILSAIGVDATRSQAKEEYDKYIVDETIIIIKVKSLMDWHLILMFYFSSEIKH